MIVGGVSFVYGESYGLKQSFNYSCKTLVELCAQQVFQTVQLTAYKTKLGKSLELLENTTSIRVNTCLGLTMTQCPDLEDDAIVELARFALAAKTMHLDLSHCRLSDQKIPFILEMIHNSKALESISLPDHIYGDGLMQIIQALKATNCTLQTMRNIDVRHIPRELMEDTCAPWCAHHSDEFRNRYTELHLRDLFSDRLVGILRIVKLSMYQTELGQYLSQLPDSYRRSIAIWKRTITDMEAVELACFIYNFKASKLELSGCKISESGIGSIANVIRYSRSLNHFAVINCGVTNKGLICIAKAIHKRSYDNRVLKVLRLSGNAISEDGVWPAFDYGCLFELDTLELSYNLINDRAAELMVVRFFNQQFNKSGRTTLLLDGNPISPNQTKKLAQLVEKNNNSYSSFRVNYLPPPKKRTLFLSL